MLLLLIVAALVFFALEWVPADVVGLGLVLALVLNGSLSPKQAFAGFGSETVIMILGLLILTAALLNAGVVDLVGRAILRRTGKSVNAILFMVMLAVATFSAFISNTAAAAFFVPVVMGVATKAGVSPSRLLMPMAFAAILPSSVTLISTSTNLVINGLMTNAGLEPMSMFEMAPLGIPIATTGLLYMFFIGRRWIPDRAKGEELIERFGVRSYLSEVVLLPSSPLVGKSLVQSSLGHDLDLSVLRIVRDKNQYHLPHSDMVLQAGDVLLVEGPHEELLKVKSTAGIEIKEDLKLSDPNLRGEDTALVEALVVPGSPLVGRTLKTMQFRERYRLQVLGLNRHGKNLLRSLSRIALRVGDVMLLQGRKANVTNLENERAFSVLGTVEDRQPDRARALRTAAVFCGSLALGALEILPLSVAVLLGAFLIFATKCVSPSDAYREVEWRAVILVGCMLALGEAMSSTGTAAYLAGLVVSLTQDLPPVWVLGGFYVLTVLLTQPMSNQAAAVVLLPIALQAAEQLQLNPRPFAITIAVAASCSFLTPLEPACLMVYGPGRYRFTDFMRVGAPLTVLLLILTMLLLPRVWPLALTGN
jgi:di/tricarboxylate transporter